jgi:hypothetical protein
MLIQVERSSYSRQRNIGYPRQGSERDSTRFIVHFNADSKQEANKKQEILKREFH